MINDSDKSLFTKKSKAGKGDVPRNISDKFRKNYDSIDWGRNRAKFQIRIDKNTTAEFFE